MKMIHIPHCSYLYNYDARQYDCATARFTTPDPLAEKYYGWNMYGYCMNNPIIYIDLDGKAVFVNGKIGGGSPASGVIYWNGMNSSFVKGAQDFFNDKNISFSNMDYGVYVYNWLKE